MKFRVRMGAEFAQNPTLLVNLPLKSNVSESAEESKEESKDR